MGYSCTPARPKQCPRDIHCLQLSVELRKAGDRDVEVLHDQKLCQLRKLGREELAVPGGPQRSCCRQGRGRAAWLPTTGHPYLAFTGRRRGLSRKWPETVVSGAELVSNSAVYILRIVIIGHAFLLQVRRKMKIDLTSSAAKAGMHRRFGRP